MQVSYVFLVLMLIGLAISELPISKQLPFSKWPSKGNKPLVNPKSGRRTFVLQIRSNSDSPAIVVKRLPQQHLLRGRPVRPLKLGLSPHFLYKPHVGLKRPLKPTLPAKVKFNGSPPAEYFYEKPFSPAPQLYKEPIENVIHLTNDQFGPIHTVPAPNLGSNSPFDFETNHIQIEEHKFTPQPQNFKLHQYQVTEEPTNDLTLLDPLSGKQKYYAPDPDPSLPAPKLHPSTDPLSMPSNGKPLPLDVQSNFLSLDASNQLSQPLIQNLQPAATHLSQGYALQVANQPQLQQFLLQQASSSPTLSVYNPTYLVTQSNNLYNQHQQQQLFKPNSNFVNSINSPQLATTDLSQEVASNGQILQAARDPTHQIHPEFVQNQDNPQFAALVGLQPNGVFTENILSQQPQIGLTHHQLSNVYQGYDQVAHPQEVSTSSFISQIPAAESYQNHLDLTQRQLENEHKLQQANLKLQQQYFENEQLSAYEQHQQHLQQQLNGNPLRIFVPDDEYALHESYIQKRSDDYSNENAEESEEKGFVGMTSSLEISGEHKTT